MSQPVFDAIGNELREGLLVAVDLEKPRVIGKIVKVINGGIINPHDKGGMAMPAKIVIGVEINLTAMPGSSVGIVTALREPKESPSLSTGASQA